jgi:hypothetical protein
MTSLMPAAAHSAITRRTIGIPPTGSTSFAPPPVMEAMRVPLPPHGMSAFVTVTGVID